ncbi:MAG: hypothetical protein WAM91_03260 [Candidatus Acidiferrales bacterium]
MKFRGLFLSLVFAFSGYSNIISQSGPQPFTITLIDSRPVISPGAEARIQITLTNTSSRDASFGREARDDEAEAHCTVDVRNSVGDPAPDTALGLRLKGKDSKHIPFEFGSHTMVTLKPGESLKEEAVISKLFDITIPGKYSVQVIRQIPQELGGGAIKSNIIIITVTN